MTYIIATRLYYALQRIEGCIFRKCSLSTWSIDSDNQITATIPTGTIAATYHTVVVTGFGESPQTAIEEAAMLHDIGIFLTDQPEIGCYW